MKERMTIIHQKTNKMKQGKSVQSLHLKSTVKSFSFFLKQAMAVLLID